MSILGLTNRILVVDTETASPVNIKKQGMYRYWQHPETRVLMTGVKWLGDERPAPCYDHTALGQLLPTEIVDAINAPPGEVMLAAANREFDRFALHRMGFHTPQEKWVDILILAYILGFSGNLDAVLKQTGIGVHKDSRGRRCISYFSVGMNPWHSDPELYQDFITYCAKDAEIEERLLSWCLRWLDTDWMRPSVQRVIEQDWIYGRVNRRGIPIDLKAVDAVIQARDSEMGALMQEMGEITGLGNPNSRNALLGWLNSNGARLDSIAKEPLRDEIERLKTDGLGKGPAAVVLQLRREYAKTSTKKFDALKAATDPGDGRLRGGWQFLAASRTGRVGGRILNPANLPRPVVKEPEIALKVLKDGGLDLMRAMFPGPVLDVLSSCVRACVTAPEGKNLCVFDYKSIESVGAAWLAGCRTILDTFFAGKDTYVEFYSRANEVPYEDVTKKQRTYSKPVVLGAQYRMWTSGLVNYASSLGVTLEEDDALQQILAFRALYHEIVHYWYQLDDAAMGAVRHPGKVFSAYAVDRVTSENTGRNGRTYRTYSYADWPRVDYWSDGSFLFCRIPSGRFLCYHRPTVERRTFQPTDPGQLPYTKDVLYYYGLDRNANVWQKISSHSGLRLENINQAMCRDVLWDCGLTNLENDPRYEVIGDVYDEIWTVVADDFKDAGETMRAHMTRRAEWMDNRFFLGAEGYTARQYRKD